MKLGRNEYIVAILTKVIMVFMGLVESIILARYLGAELRGQVSYINSIVQIGYVVATFGIYTAYPYYRQKESKEAIMDRMLSITYVMFGIYIIVALLVAFLFKINMEYIYIAILIPVFFYDKIISFIFLIETTNKINAIVLLASLVKLIYYGGLYIVAPKTLGWGISTLIIAPAIESIYFTFNLRFNFSLKYCKPSSLIPLISYGILPMIALLMTTLNYRIDVIMLRQYDTISLSDIGVYSIGITLAEKVLLVSDAVKEILLSKLAKGKGESEVAKVMRLCFFVSFLMAIAVSLASKMFISILYGSEYNGAETVTNISVWGTIFMVYFKMISQYNVANRRQKYNVIFLGAAILLNVILNSLFIPIIGINGAALATAIGYCFSSLIFVVYFHKISNINYRDMLFINRCDIDIVKLFVKQAVSDNKGIN